jgi:hypothetical protein
MGGAHGKISQTSSPNVANAYDVNDPRSPSMKRTPLSTPEDWRQKALRARAKEDPRSPGIERTPVVDPPLNVTEPVTPLTLSYEECNQIASDDPRSPMQFRTPLNYTQGIVQYDKSVVSCPHFVDDTVIVSNAHEPVDTNELNETISVSSSGIINHPLADLSIVTASTEVVVQPEELNVTARTVTEVNTTMQENTKEVVETRDTLIQSLDVEVPSSPLGASAYKLEDSDKKVKPVEHTSSPALPTDRKRKKQGNSLLIGVSPLKKSYSSPCIAENDENASPILEVVPLCTTPTTPRHTTPLRAPSTPPTPRRAPGTPTHKRTPSAPTHKRTPSASRPSNLKNSEGIAKSPRSPLSPIIPRAHQINAPALLL